MLSNRFGGSLGAGRDSAQCREAWRAQRAFTMVELILVMTLLVVVIGLAAPTLSRSFSGRTLEHEANRFVALTRYGQSQAVSEGVPTVLWVNPQGGTYGLRQETGASPLWATTSSEPLRNQLSGQEPWIYTLGKDLSFDLGPGARLTNGVATIRFESDGAIDEESLDLLMLRGKGDDAIPVTLSHNRLRYEIPHQTNLWGRWFP